MQIVKPASEPSNDMILSKDGMKMATMTINSGRTIRIVSLRMPRVSPDMPVNASVVGSERLSSPQNISTVLTIGRVLSQNQLPSTRSGWTNVLKRYLGQGNDCNTNDHEDG
jgi:hypothetical protein